MTKINKLLSNTSIDRRTYQDSGAQIMLNVLRALGFNDSDKQHYLMYFTDTTDDKYIIMEVYFQYGVVCSCHTISNNGLSFSASNVQGTVVISGATGTVSVCTIPCRW